MSPAALGGMSAALGESPALGGMSAALGGMFAFRPFGGIFAFTDPP